MRAVDARPGLRLRGQARGFTRGNGGARGFRQRFLRRGDLLRQSIPALGNLLGRKLDELGRLVGARAPKRI